VQIRAPIIVGRDDELKRLDVTLTAARACSGGALFLTGEAGIGKSRLAQAAQDFAYESGMRTLRGRGSPIGPMVPFRPLREALMSLLRFGDPVDVNQLGPYRAVLARLIPDWGPPSAPEERASLVVLAEAVLRLTALAGKDRGCLLVLDDLQDSDPETLVVVDYLADNLDHQPTLLLGTVRADPCPALDVVKSAIQRGSGTQIELGRLDRPDLRRLAAVCLECEPDEVPAEVAEQLWTSSEGIPLLAEELLGEMRSDGLLERGSEGWRVTGPLQAKVPVTLTRSVARRLDMIVPDGRRLLSVAAVLGRRFPVEVLQEATGMGDRELLNHLQGELTAQFVSPDDETPDWYAFAHPLLRDVLLNLLTPAERGRITGQAIAAVEAVFPGLPGEWCQVAATLHAQAGHKARAGQLFAEAGRRALTQGAAHSAVALLDEALRLLAEGGDAQGRAEAFATRLYALTEAGLVERAVASSGELEQMAGLLDHRARARLHTRLAWATMMAGRSADGLAQVETARGLLGDTDCDQDTAAVDAVAAHLVLDLTGPDQVSKAEALARRAADVAERTDMPIVACQAWQLLGSLTRTRDPDEGTTCLERARQIAVLHDLPVEEIHALLRLGNDDAVRTGSLDRLRQTQRLASQAGAVMSRFQAESSIALHLILHGDFIAAGAMLDQVLESTTRLKLLETTRYSLIARAIMAAHRGRRRDMDTALAQLQRCGGDLALYTPRVHGLARTWCALLEEDRPRAREELSVALAAEKASPTHFQLTGRYGLDLLLRALDGELDWDEYQEVTSAPVSKLRWDRQFSLFARAVLAGRDGQSGQAAETVTEALAVAAPYATGRHLALRLVSEAAIADGWGSPVDWLRACDEYFHEVKVKPVASACRALIRRAGAPVGQRRRGVSEIPPALRAKGVTVREHEILQLLTERLSNREIANRLHLSPRTVENHIANLIAKTGEPDRIALGELGR
jgi:ATP/maltotriose-dependent transcriptional regulator MalT